MKLINRLSTALTLALLSTATCVNAQTNNVITSEVVKVESTSMIDIMNTVELSLADSMTQIHSSLASDMVNNQKQIIAQARPKSKSKLLLVKQTLSAD